MLSLKEIGLRIQKSSNVTYQAVYKAINELVEKGILEKNEKLYGINKLWTAKIKGFIQRVEKDYEEIIKKLEDEKVIKIDFKSISEFSKFTFYFLVSLAEKNKGKKLLINQRRTYNLYWLTKDDYEKFLQCKNLFEIYILCDIDNELERWFSKIWEKIDTKVEYGANYCQTYDFFAIDDYVMEIFFNPESKSYWENKQANTIKEYDMSESINEIMKEQPMHIVLLKDPALAEEIRERTLKRFDN